MARIGKLIRTIIPLLTLLGSGLMAPPSDAAENQRLVFLHYWTGDMSGGITEMIKTFNQEHPGYDVQEKGFEHETFKTSIKVMLEVGHPPDLFSYWAGARIQELVDHDYLAPIDTLWEKAQMDQRFNPAVAGACTYSGRKFVIPVTQHLVAFFYNKKTFTAAGIQAPKTFEEFKKICDTLKKNRITPIALGSREKWPAQFWFDYLLLRSAGPDYRQQLMQGKAAYTSPQVAKVFDLWRELITLGCFNADPNLFDWSEAGKMVYNGEAAMTLMGTWIIGMFDTQLNWRQGKDYDFFVFPVIDEKLPQVCLGPIDGIVVPKEGQAARAAATLDYFAGINPQKAMSKGSGALAPNQQIPAAFYTGLQQRILEAIQKAPLWAFNFDLATPPPVAEIGLECFFNFLANPKDAAQILSTAETRMQRARQP